MLTDPEKRVRWITRDQARRLLELLPEHQRPMMRFDLEVGLRRRNVTHMDWNQIDLERRMAWIYPDQAKAGKAIGVPLSDEAIVILKGQIGKHPVWVFPYQRETRQADINKGMAESSKSSRNSPRISVARSSAYLGKLARPRWHTVERVAGTWWMGLCGDGAALCTPLYRAFGYLGKSTYRPTYYGRY